MNSQDSTLSRLTCWSRDRPGSGSSLPRHNCEYTHLGRTTFPRGPTPREGSSRPGRRSPIGSRTRDVAGLVGVAGDDEPAGGETTGGGNGEAAAREGWG